MRKVTLFILIIPLLYTGSANSIDVCNPDFSRPLDPILGGFINGYCGGALNYSACVKRYFRERCAEQQASNQGSQRQKVLKLQQTLKAAGYDPGPIDGIFGQKTKRALNAYKRDHGD